MLPLYHQNNNRPHLFNKQRNIVSALGWVFILWIASSITSIPGSSLKPCWSRTNCPPRGRPTHWQTALWLFWIFFIAPKLVIHGDQTWLILYQNCIIYNVYSPLIQVLQLYIADEARPCKSVETSHRTCISPRADARPCKSVVTKGQCRPSSDRLLLCFCCASPTPTPPPPLICYCCASVVLLLLLLWYSSVVLLNRTPHWSNGWAITPYY